MAQTAISEPDWGAAYNTCAAAIAASGTSDIISYSIAGRTVTKSRREMYEHLDYLREQYNIVSAGSSVTLIDRRSPYNG